MWPIHPAKESAYSILSNVAWSHSDPLDGNQVHAQVRIRTSPSKSWRCFGKLNKEINCTHRHTVALRVAPLLNEARQRQSDNVLLQLLLLLLQVGCCCCTCVCLARVLALFYTKLGNWINAHKTYGYICMYTWDMYTNFASWIIEATTRHSSKNNNIHCWWMQAHIYGCIFSLSFHWARCLGSNWRLYPSIVC